MNKMQEIIGEVNFRNLVFRFDDDDVSGRLFSSFFRLFSSTGLFIPFLLGILLCFDPIYPLVRLFYCKGINQNRGLCSLNIWVCMLTAESCFMLTRVSDMKCKNVHVIPFRKF